MCRAGEALVFLSEFSQDCRFDNCPTLSGAFVDSARATRNSSSLADGEGWNYIIRLYRPHKEILDGKWKFPPPQPVG